MENKRLSTVWSEFHLPEDLWAGILSRLPVKSLLRFRCVSKSWLSMINDPDFCRLHLKNFVNNRDETDLLVVQGIQQNCVVRWSDTFETRTEMLFSLGDRYREGNWRVECSIDGLVLLKSRRRSLSGLSDLMVWNPSIRKFHDVPTLPEIEAFPISTSMDVDIGMGYDLLVKDYKHVKLIFGPMGSQKLGSVAIYTLRTASWKIIQFQCNGSSNWHWCPIYRDMKAVYVRGNLYFIAKDWDSYVSELVWIDLSSEVFTCTSLPDSVNFRSVFCNGSLTLVDGGCSLAACDFESDPSMWVLESSSMCWTKRYSFGFGFLDFLYLKKNGDILMQWLLYDDKTTIRLTSGKEVVQQWTLVLSYNLETEKEMILTQEKHHCF